MSKGSRLLRHRALRPVARIGEEPRELLERVGRRAFDPFVEPAEEAVVIDDEPAEAGQAVRIRRGDPQVGAKPQPVDQRKICRDIHRSRL